MVLRVVAVGVASLLAVGCVKSDGRPSAPLDVVVVAVHARDTELGAAAAEGPDAPSYSSRDEVEVEWRGRWWPATVMDRRGAGRFMVHYTGYGDEWDEVVGLDRIRLRRAPDPEPANDPVETDSDP